MRQVLTTGPEGSVGPPAAMLQDTLIELITLSLQAKQAHWNVTGPGFRPLHELLDELTDQYRDWYDTVAERMTAIGVAPDGRLSTIGAAAPFAELPEGQLLDGDVIRFFDERISVAAGRVRDRSNALADGDIATQDVLIEVLRGMEKQRWMIRAHRT